MRNNIKKATARFWEDLLYFKHFVQIFVFTANHLKCKYFGTNHYPNQISIYLYMAAD